MFEYLIPNKCIINIILYAIFLILESLLLRAIKMPRFSTIYIFFGTKDNFIGILENV